MPRSPRIRLTLASLAVALIAGAVAAAAPPEGASSLTILPRAEGKHFEAALAIPRESDGPLGRLLILPRGARTIVPLAGDPIRVGPVMVMRGTPVAPIWIDSLEVLRLAEAGTAQATLAFDARDAGGKTIVAAGPTAPSVPDGNAGGYLIIAADPFADAVRPLVEWKTACGYPVTVLRTSETGRTLNEIREVVRTAYHTWEIPPLYLLLVGDVEDIPSGDMVGNVSDHYYACVDGEDFLPDLYVGRICAKNAAEVAVQVAKIVGYESRPDTTGIAPGETNTWFNRALMVAGNHGSSTPVPTCDWAAEELSGIGFAQVSRVYYPPFSDGCSGLYGCPIGDAINRGVSIVNYRGWARENPPGWDVPDYTTDDIVRLVNGWKLPYVFSIVCNTGDFGRPDEDSFGEIWMKAGTVDSPLGAVGFIGTAEHWSRTRWNDRIDLEIFQTLCHDGESRVGPILAAAKASLLIHFPTEIYLAGAVEEEAVEFYAYIYNILGDPSLEIWTARPRPLRISEMPPAIGFGTNSVTLRVTEDDGTTPVSGARVAFAQDGRVAGYAISDATGAARVSLDLSSTAALLCTVTGVNLHPWQATVPVAQDERALTCAGAEVAGATGPMPGAIADVTVTARNTGTSPIASATASLAGPEGVELIESTTEFGAIAPGAVAASTRPLRVRLAAATENGARLRFTLTPTSSGATLPATEFRLTAAAPELVCESATDGADGVFDPGEEFDLVLRLRNDGPVGGGALAATLSLLDPGAGATIVDAEATFPEIAPAATAENAADPFRLRIGPTVAAGTVIPYSLDVRAAEGPTSRVTGNLVVGRVDASAPVGPDAYGYYAYDSADIDYPASAPAYRWVEISPRYGGPGTYLGIDIDDRVPKVVALPFSFTYYGQPYDSARVSDNGWIAFDTTYFFDTRNWSMPDRWGSACQVAAFWDNLNPMIPGTDGIYSWFDAENHRFVIEWNRLRNFEETANHWQSFQILLYDPAWRAGPTGDGEIVFQYKHIVNDDWKNMYSTVGIEDQTEEIGLQYSYSNLYAPGAAPLAPGLAIRLTTDPPVYRPIALDRFEARWSPGGARAVGVVVRWQLREERPIAGFELTRSTRLSADAPWSEGERVHEGLIDPAAGEFADATADPEASYRYRLQAIGAAGVVRPLGEVVYQGIPQGPLLRLVSGSPSSGEARLLLRPGSANGGEVAVFDAAGRRVRTLLAEARAEARANVLTWDGRDARGRDVPSGLYWVKLIAGPESRTARLAIVR
jgi:hypothetical protein